MLLFFFAVYTASTSVIGIIASVLVSLTVTALSSDCVPRCHILSHVDAAAVTEDVSFTAVPAKIPNASPLVVLIPIICPNIGNISAAITLKKNITEIDCATSSSVASITGAVAAIADPPHIDEPTPTSVAEFTSTFIIFCIMYASTRDVEIVHTIIGSDWAPVSSMTPKLSPNPNNTTAICRIYFEVNFIPFPNLPLSVQKSVITIPKRIEKTGPPTTGTNLPSNQAGMAIARHTISPGNLVLNEFM